MKQKNLIIGIAIVILLLGGIGLGVYLTQQQQDLRQQAEEPAVTPTGPACLANEASCEWDKTPDATSYHYTIKEIESGAIIDEGDVISPTTRVTFTSEPNKTYECSVYAINSCGQGDAGVGQSSCFVSPTPSASPSATPTTEPSPTPTTPVVNTPTPTEIPTPTPTTPISVPTPTPTPTTPPLPTNPPPLVATNTPVPPLATPTPTQIAVGPTSTPTPTMEAPGSALQTITIAGGVLLTIIGAIVLFIL